jgi:hypothetical protein
MLVKFENQSAIHHAHKNQVVKNSNQLPYDGFIDKIQHYEHFRIS